MTETDEQLDQPNNRAWIVVGLVAVGLLAGIVAIVVDMIVGAQMPIDSPVPMMFRTEAQMQAILSAIEKYHEMNGVYPPSGIDGQKAAVAALNSTVLYLTELPQDAWNRHFVYVRASDYDKATSGAIKNSVTGQFYNPDTYQLYSLGMDGKQSRDDEPADLDSTNADNVNNWDSHRTWRKVYRARQKTYAKTH